jgi:DNA-binding NarL/FixJ family response regulator
VGILILSQHVETGTVNRLIGDSARGLGYLLKDRVTDLEDFVDALKRVAGGGTAFDPKVLAELFTGAGADPLAPLTPREREVLALVAEGRANKGIAERLVLSEGAVQKYVSSIFTKLALPGGDEDHRRVLSVLTYLRAS